MHISKLLFFGSILFLVVDVTLSSSSSPSSTCDVTVGAVAKILCEQFPYPLHPKQIAKLLTESSHCNGSKVEKSAVIQAITALIEDSRATRMDDGVIANFEEILPLREVGMILKDAIQSKANSIESRFPVAQEAHSDEDASEHNDMFCVNIGGGNYQIPEELQWLRSDPTYELFLLDKWAGVVLDSDRDSIRVAKKNITSKKFRAQATYVSPNNILKLLEHHGVPKDFDILKIDIDSFDAVIVEMILTKYKPKVINVEINSDIPVPISFAVGYRKGAKRSPPNHWNFFGATLTYWSKLLRPLGYSLLLADVKYAVEGAVYVLNEYIPAFYEHVNIPPNDMIAFRIQVRNGRHTTCNRMQQHQGFSCDEMDALALKDPFELVGQLYEHFVNSSTVHNDGLPVPFTIAVDSDSWINQPFDGNWKYSFDKTEEKGQIVFVEQQQQQQQQDEEDNME